MDRLELHRHRQAIRSGLARSNRSILLNSVLIVGLALLAIWVARIAGQHATTAELKAREASEAGEEAQRKLWDAYLAQARVERLSQEAGRKRRGLEAIAAAAAIRPAPELVDEAVATLALYDIGEELVYHPGLPVNYEPHFTSGLDRYLMVQSARRLTLNDAVTGKPLRTFKLEAPYFAGAGLSPNDRFASAYDTTGTWTFWALDDPDRVHRIPFRTYVRTRILPDYRPGSDHIVLCGTDRSVRIFDLASEAEQRMEFPLQPNRVAFNHDGSRLAVAAEASLYLVSWDSLKVDGTQDFSARINEVCWAPGRDELVLALENGDVVQYNPGSGAVLVMRGHSHYASKAFYHPDGNLIVSTSWDRTSRFWDAANGQLLFTSVEAMAMKFNRDGTKLAFYRQTAGAGIWSFERPIGLRQLLAPLVAMNNLKWVDVHPSLPLVAACRSGEFLIWNYETGTLLFRRPFQDTFSVLFGPAGERLFVTGYGGLQVFQLVMSEGDLRLEELPLEKPLSEAAYLERSAMAGDASFYAVGGHNRGYVMDPRTFEITFEFGEGLGALAYTAISPGGKWLLSTSWKQVGTVLWELSTQRQLGVLTPYASAAEFSPDATLLATCNNRGLQLWETGTWKLRHKVDESAASYGPGPVRFSPDGRFVVTPLRLRTISFYDVQSGLKALRLSNPNHRNNDHLAFSRDGTKLFSATQDRAVHLWDLAELRQRTAGMSLPWPLAPGLAVADTFESDTAPLGSEGGYRPLLGTVSLNLIVGTIIIGMLVAVFFSGYTLRQQRQLVGSYDRVEQVAEAQNRRLLSQEAELQQSQKMQALGTLAAGVAHDFNNLLSVISLANDFLRRGTRGDAESEEETQAIAKAVAQGRQVVEGMLGYSRSPEASARKEFNLCDLVEDTVGLLGQQFLSGIRLTLELDRTVPDLYAAPGKIEQILLNLIINASDAMSGQGKLLIRVWQTGADRINARVRPPAKGPLRLQVLEVSDNGSGIPPDLLGRIFEPFFTTKSFSARRGTGLGLSTIYTIAEHEGYGLDVESAVGDGTTFKVFLPVTPARQTPSDTPVPTN
jgi:signal transduction histidine kinase